MTEPLLMSVRGAARLLGIGRDSAYTLVREGRLPAIRIGRRILVPTAALEQWVEDEAAKRSAAWAPWCPGLVAQEERRSGGP